MIEIIGINDRKEVKIGDVTVELAPLSYEKTQEVLSLGAAGVQSNNLATQTQFGLHLQKLMIKNCVKKITVPGGIAVKENGEVKEFELAFDEDGSLDDFSLEVVLRLQFLPDLAQKCYEYFAEVNNIQNVKGVKQVGKSKKKATKRKKKA